MRPAEPLGDLQRTEMREWHRVYQRQLQPVRMSWSGLAGTLRDGQPAALPGACERFRRSVDGIDTQDLFPVPDAAVQLHLARVLRHLREAAVRCRHGRYFSLTFRLEMAALGFRDLRRVMSRYRLSP
jgi:hypothetical protein